MTTILAFDARGRWREHVQTTVEFLGHRCMWIGNPGDPEVTDAVSDDAGALLVVDAGSRDSLLEVLVQARERFPGLPVYLLQDGAPSRDQPLPAALAGCMALPLRYRPLATALESAALASRRVLPERLSCGAAVGPDLVGDSPAITKVRRMIEQVASSEANVLILGESGTGKEVVARKLHYFSARRDKPFVPINCGAIPAELLESELFGHEKGAFTGAIAARQGRFEMAEGGTLFLDEIGDMSLPMQVKILRVLQERIFERVGSNRSIRADVRILAATHRNLEGLIEEGRFREDLFYRLNVFPIEMPPLRERREDIPLLIEELVLRFRNERRVSVKLTEAAITALQSYPFPGNVRELANLIERLTILYPNGSVDFHDLPEKYTAHLEAPPRRLAPDPLAPDSPSVAPESLPRLPREGLDIKEHLNQLEYTLIKQALDEAGGVVAHAAERLRLRRTTLVEKLRKYGLARGLDQVIGF